MISTWLLHIIRYIINSFLSIYHGKHVAWKLKAFKTYTGVAYLVLGSASYLKWCSLASWITYLWFLDNVKARIRKFSVSYSWLTFPSKAKTLIFQCSYSASYIRACVHCVAITGISAHSPGLACNAKAVVPTQLSQLWHSSQLSNHLPAYKTGFLL